MNVLDQARVLIYRINKKGLEIFLVKSGEQWEFPCGSIGAEGEKNTVILLNPVENDAGEVENGIALEGDWHDIPSIRAMVKTDVEIVKHRIKEILPDVEKGAFFAAKEAFKKVLPAEYALLKELKEILVDRNQAKYI